MNTAIAKEKEKNGNKTTHKPKVETKCVMMTKTTNDAFNGQTTFFYLVVYVYVFLFFSSVDSQSILYHIKSLGSKFGEKLFGFVM